MDDADTPGSGGEAALVLVEDVGGAQGVVAADGDERVDLQVEERLVDAAQAVGAPGLGKRGNLVTNLCF